ncbi:MAG: DUF4870 domain-containing protein [Spirochaetales bacterium]|nr:DUF4870 domain-containing protein [Leptospiraceae bacterium]MCP5482274.1 DUF4870 domain-containing protein [Spirochaetales bacterium]
MSDKVRDIQSKIMKNLHGGDQIAAAVAYVPLFGWVFALVLKKDDDFCQFHGRQAMKLNLVLVVLFFAIWVLENFPLFSWAFGEAAFLHPISRSVWLISVFAFLALSAVGAYKAFSEERWEIPYLNELVDTALDQIKGGAGKGES